LGAASYEFKTPLNAIDPLVKVIHSPGKFGHLGIQVRVDKLLIRRSSRSLTRSSFAFKVRFSVRH
jgi:hypothetical protein